MTHAVSLPEVACNEDAQVVDGYADDVSFLVNEVALAATDGHFSFEYLAHRARRALAWRCAKAILHRSPVFRWLEHADFLVVRYCGRTVAAALIVFEDDRERPGYQVAILGYLVVDACYRGYGFGSRLVRAIQTRVPRSAKVQCWCTPYSQGMQRLLARLGFKQAAEAKVVQADADVRLVMPSLWVWCS